MELELTVVSGTTRRDVLAHLDGGATVRQLRSALKESASDDYAGLWHGDRFVADAVTVAAAGLRSGDMVGLDGPLPRPVRAGRGPLVVAAVGGLDAGGSVDLAPGREVTVGRAPQCALRLRDAEVSRTHARLRAGRSGGLGGPGGSAVVEVQDLGSRNGVGHRGVRLDPVADLAIGENIRLGESLVQVRTVRGVAADVTDDPATGSRAFNRPPLFEPTRTSPTLVVPLAPARPGGFRMPWAAALMPLVMGAAIYLLFPRFGAYLIIMMAMSPVLLVANAVSERRGGRKSYRAQLREYAAACRRFETDLAAAARYDELTSRHESPDPAELIRRATAPDAALWQRRRASDRFLQLRVGVADRPARVTLQRSATDQELPPAPTVHEAPVTVPLRESGVIGVAAPRAALLAVARALVVQLTALHSPGEVAVAVLTGADTAADWRWATWLPHTRPLPGRRSAFACERLVAVDGEQAAARVTELLRLVDERTGEQRARLAAGPPPGQALVVVVDGARRMRAVPGISRLLANGPASGVYAICLDADVTALPDECGATVVAASRSGTRASVRIVGRDPVDDVLVDGIGLNHAEQAARAQTALRALGDSDADRGLPDTVRFTELATAQPDPQAVLRRWRGPGGGRSARALLGVAAGGAVEIDLVRDGPHGLVAGTSGSGKSELLQTFVTSLALGNRPDALNFVLVDYKGGSAFAACADLPHCAGVITDLDGHLVARALDSLSAELKRRETMLADAGAKDIADYWARTGAALPRLVIVVDEFASLVEEVPDFVPGVVGIGMRGRSLGVHVVLATQRPAGVVSADLRANLNLRVCLRVTSDAESNDVIDSPAAARILPRQPGRAYLRTGHSELTRFQAARVGWPLPEPEAAQVAEPVVVVEDRRIESIGLPPARAERDDVDEHGRTDLSELVQAIRSAATEIGLAEPRRPWLPPLPDQVPYELLAARALPPSAALIGVVDRPAQQAQEPFAVDLDGTGPVLVAGAVRSGRSTVLRTLAASLTTRSPEDVHIYVLDCGNHALAALDGFPQCGAVVDGADPDRTSRLLAMLGEQVVQRQRAFMASGYGSLAEQRAATAPGQQLPHVVLLLDRLESFVGRYDAIDNGALVDRLETLIRTGPAVGITCVLATDRTGLTHRIGSAVAARLVLAQATTDDLLYFGVDHTQVPSHMPAGRGIWTPTGAEVQVAYVGADPSGAAQLARLRELRSSGAARWHDVPAERMPRRLDPLPESIGRSEVESLRTQPRPAGAGVVTVGAGGDHLAPVDVDLAASGSSFVVCGPGRSGRSTALRSLVESMDGSLPVIVVAPRPSPLRDLELPGARVLTSDLGTALPAALRDQPCCALVVDDGELLNDLVVQDVLEDFARSARDRGSLLIAAATTEDLLLNRYRGWLATARRDRNGLLLNPAGHVDGEVFDLRLPRGLNGGWPAGRALLVRGGVPSLIQVTGAAASPVTV